MQEYIIINEKDNVAVALADLKVGMVIKAKDKEVVVKEDSNMEEDWAIYCAECNEKLFGDEK